MTRLNNTDLDQLKMQAKALLRSARAKNQQALGRFAPYFDITPDSPPRLHQAQLVIARELGYSSWAKLKAAIEQSEGPVRDHMLKFKRGFGLPAIKIRPGSFLGKIFGINRAKAAQVRLGKRTPDELLCCSFCGKSSKEIKKLISGPGVFICNECVGLCNAIIGDVSGTDNDASR